MNGDDITLQGTKSLRTSTENGRNWKPFSIIFLYITYFIGTICCTEFSVIQ